MFSIKLDFLVEKANRLNFKGLYYKHKWSPRIW